MMDGNRVKRTLYFIMVWHPLKGRMRVGNAYGTRKNAQSWTRFVKADWRGLPVQVSQCTLTFQDGKLSPKSARTLDKKFNLGTPDEETISGFLKMGQP